MTFNTLSFLLQAGALLVALAAVHKPLGLYRARVVEGPRTARAERLLSRLTGVDAGTEQTWPVYLRGVLAFSAFSILLVSRCSGSRASSRAPDR